MSLQFRCSHCHELITVSHVGIGEEALCFNCGQHTVVPPDCLSTEAPPDYLHMKKADAKEPYEPRKTDILKPSPGQLFFTIIFTAALTLLEHVIFPEDQAQSKAIRIILMLIFAYLSSFLPHLQSKPEKELEKITRGPAPKDCECQNCHRHIVKGEPVFMRSEFLTRLFRKNTVLCVSCYNDLSNIFRNPSINKKGAQAAP